MKRRWIVVMLGLRGLAAGHRSELSRHRSQESARIAALESLARLREGHVHLGPDYTVVVEHEGQQYLVDDTDGAPVSDLWAERGRAAKLHGPGPLEDIVASDYVAPRDPAADSGEAEDPEIVPVVAEARESAAAAERQSPEGDALDGDALDGDALDSDALDGDAPEGDALEGDAPQVGEPPTPPIRRRRAPDSDTPSGPVPDGLLSKWEEKVAAYDEWEARRAEGPKPDASDAEEQG